MKGTRESCSCDDCQAACKFKPGWFLPGEAEKAAELLGMEFDEFFQKYLSVDWWVSSDNIYVLAPSNERSTPGGMYASNPKGACVFYQENKCAIHAAKPYECRMSLHTSTSDELSNRHREVSEAWQDHQDEVEVALGYKPDAGDYSLSEALLW